MLPPPPVPTCGVSLVDGPVVHLQCRVAAAPGEAHHVVLAVVHHGVALLDSDVIRAHVENNPNRALVLWRVSEQGLLEEQSGGGGEFQLNAGSNQQGSKWAFRSGLQPQMISTTLIMCAS